MSDGRDPGCPICAATKGYPGMGCALHKTGVAADSVHESQRADIARLTAELARVREASDYWNRRFGETCGELVDERAKAARLEQERDRLKAAPLGPCNGTVGGYDCSACRHRKTCDSPHGPNEPAPSPQPEATVPLVESAVAQAEEDGVWPVDVVAQGVDTKLCGGLFFASQAASRECARVLSEARVPVKGGAK